MKITSILDYKNFQWNNDSCDVWIDPSGKVFDLGVDSTHLTFVKESIDNTTETKDLINSGWIKLTNTKLKVYIESKNNSLNKHKNLIVPVLLEKAKTQGFILEISFIDKNQKLEFLMPKDKVKIFTLL